MYKNIKKQDEEIFNLIKAEEKRQKECLELIPSENIVSLPVLEAMGSILTNKYSEGFPRARYYGGNEIIDKIEILAQERAKKLFGVPFVNVQPYSGSPANFAVYIAVCNPGDKVMGQHLFDGGHLTHGWKHSATAKFFKTVHYHVKKNGVIDIKEARKIAKKEKPKLIWVGATAYTKTIPFKEFSKIADEVGAYLVADIAHIAGLIIGEAHPSPVSYVDIITSTTHKTLRGPRAGIIMVTEKGLKKDAELAKKINKAIMPGSQGGPHNHIIAGMAVAFKEASKPTFKKYAKQICKNAEILANELMKNGLNLIGNGTENHLILIDCGKGRGELAEIILEATGITVNKNTIPAEPATPFSPSGIRLGTPSITTRGMKTKEMKEIAKIIASALTLLDNPQLFTEKGGKEKLLKENKKNLKQIPLIKDLRKKVKKLTKDFPIPNFFV